MPDRRGTLDLGQHLESSAKALDGHRRANCIVGPAKPGDHGPVRVHRTHHFRYADGTSYLNIGTTAYVWNLARRSGRGADTGHPGRCPLHQDPHVRLSQALPLQPE